MNLAEDKINLIERIIKNDRKFVNNEDLYEDFFNETCKRSLSIVQTVTSDATLEAYLKKIATTSILNVLKNEGRLRRSHSGFSSTDNLSLESDIPDYENITVKYADTDIENTPENLAIKKDYFSYLNKNLNKNFNPGKIKISKKISKEEKEVTKEGE